MALELINTIKIKPREPTKKELEFMAWWEAVCEVIQPDGFFAMAEYNQIVVEGYEGHESRSKYPLADKVVWYNDENSVKVASFVEEVFKHAKNRLADAAKQGKWNQVQEILELHPSLINSTRPEGVAKYTVLHQAAFMKAPQQFVEFFLKLGADKQLKTADGKTAANIAKEKGNNLALYQ